MKRTLYGMLATTIIAGYGSVAKAQTFDTFFTQDGKRNFSARIEDVPAQAIDGCGLVFALAQSNNVVLKGTILQSVKRDDIAPKRKPEYPVYFTNMDVEIGTMKEKNFVPYDMNSLFLSARSLSRDINLGEFPVSSKNPEYVAFAQRLIKFGFTLIAQIKGRRDRYTITIDKDKISQTERLEFINCVNRIARSFVDRWREAFPDVPAACYYTPGDKKCLP